MRALLLLLALAPAVQAADPPVDANPADSPALRAYRLARQMGTEKKKSGDPYFGNRKISWAHPPDSGAFRIYQTIDEGVALCEIDIEHDLTFNDGSKLKEAGRMGLPLPILLYDRGCRGLKPHVRIEPARAMTQRQLDIFFMLVEDVLRHGVWEKPAAAGPGT